MTILSTLIIVSAIVILMIPLYIQIHRMHKRFDFMSGVMPDVHGAKQAADACVAMLKHMLASDGLTVDYCVSTHQWLIQRLDGCHAPIQCRGCTQFMGVPPYCSNSVSQRDMLFTLYRAYTRGEFKGDTQWQKQEPSSKARKNG